MHDQLGSGDAQVLVREGGPRGLTVSVSLPAAQRSSLANVQQALSAYLFEVQVSFQ